MTVHQVFADTRTVQVGVFDAAIAPVLTVRSGDTVVIECVSGEPRMLPPVELGFRVPAALTAINALWPPIHPGHILTGPIAMASAKPGDVLEVRIERIEFGVDWGFCSILPLEDSSGRVFGFSRLSLRNRHAPTDHAFSG